MLCKMKKLKLLVIMTSCALLTGAILPCNLFADTVTEEWVALSPGLSFLAITADSYGNIYVTGRSFGSGPEADYATIKYAPDGTELWMASYNGPGNSVDLALSIALDGSGNVYVTGWSSGSGTGTDYATVKYDGTNGDELWVARYKGPGNITDAAQAMAVDSSGNVYVTGWSVGSGTRYDYATVKYDGTNGNEVWEARYNGPANSNDFAHAIAVDTSGNVYVTGGSAGIGTGMDYTTVKYNQTYNTDGSVGVTEEWVARYNGPANSQEEATAMALDSSGNVYVTGYSYGSGTSKDYATIKYDTNGNQLWAARYNGSENSVDEAQAIALDILGNVYVTGGSGAEPGGADADYATVKYDGTNGDELWAARYNGPRNIWDTAYAIAVDTSGNAYVTGQTDGTTDYADYGTVKYDTNTGQQLWVAIYNNPANSWDGARAMTLDSSGNVYVTGKSGWVVGGTTIKYSQVTNHPPVANAGTDQSVHPGDVVTLDGSASTDPDENYPLTYSWQITSMPEGSMTVLWDFETVNPTFVADVMGDYIIELVVTDNLGAQSAADTVLVSTYNTPPVADAGEDQALLELYTTVQLGADPGRRSYDEDGDDITYLWTITTQPEGSAATLDDPTSATPTFVANVQGDYAINLVVTDTFNAVSEPDTVAVSFTNVKPVADAGGSQAVIVGETVFLDGSNSSDGNHDPLTYSWSFVSVPEGSLAELSDPTSVQTSFVADEVGTFVVSLVVNDGFVDSDPANVTIEVISTQDAVVGILLDLIEAIRNLDDDSLKNKNMKTPLINKVNAVLNKIDRGLYEEALDKLQNDILQKTNGCATNSQPDKNDWIIACENGQNLIYPLVIQAIELLENLI